MNSDNPDRENRDPAVNDASTSRDEIVAEIHRIREKIRVYPALSDFEKHSQYDSEEIYRHFEWYNDALKAAKAASTAPDDLTEHPKQKNETPVENDTNNAHSKETVDPPSGRESADESTDTSIDCTREELLEEIVRISERLEKKPTSIEFHRNTHYESADVYAQFDSWSDAFVAAMNYRLSGKSVAETDEQRTIKVRVTDDGTPLRGAQISVENDDNTDGQTDEEGIVEIPVSRDLNQVQLNITHRRSAKKNLDTVPDNETHSYSVDVSKSEWETDAPKDDALPEAESESEDEPSDVISAILQDMDRLEDE